MDECDPDRTDCGQRERRLLTDNGLPTNANEGKRVGKKHERREKVRERAHVGPGVNGTGFKSPTQTPLAARAQ
jgi:hypothetical protein